LKTAATEAASLTRHAHLLRLRQSGIGRIEQCIFFGAVERHVIFAAHAGIDELNDDFLTNVFQIAVTPCFKRERRGLTAALILGPVVGATGGVGFNLVGLTV